MWAGSVSLNVALKYRCSLFPPQTVDVWSPPCISALLQRFIRMCVSVVSVSTGGCGRCVLSLPSHSQVGDVLENIFLGPNHQSWIKLWRLWTQIFRCSSWHLVKVVSTVYYCHRRKPCRRLFLSCNQIWLEWPFSVKGALFVGFHRFAGKEAPKVSFHRIHPLLRILFQINLNSWS